MSLIEYLNEKSKEIDEKVRCMETLSENLNLLSSYRHNFTVLSIIADHFYKMGVDISKELPQECFIMESTNIFKFNLDKFPGELQRKLLAFVDYIKN